MHWTSGVGLRLHCWPAVLPPVSRDVKRLLDDMPYGLIVLAGSIVLTVVYVVVSDASFWSKALAAGLLLLSFAGRYGMYLQVALGVVLSLYFTYCDARH
jgi:hypothetical protein